MQTQISATIIADSINQFGDRLTSVVGEIPRMVLAEFNTHKMVVKNSASSRAIPFEKLLDRVRNDSFVPIRWMKEHKGMQGFEYFEDGKDDEHIALLETNWGSAAQMAMMQAKYLSENGVTKQFCNRLLEPFLWHKVLASATEWQNFFSLRAEPAAEIHMQDFAYKFLEEYNNSKPVLLKPGEWHLPFGDNIDQNIKDQLETIAGWDVESGKEDRLLSIIEIILKIVTARCARTSYNNFDGDSDFLKDIAMHDNNLAKNGHWSPFEHPAKSMNESEYFAHSITKVVKKEYVDYNINDFNTKKSRILVNANFTDNIVVEEFGWCGNFRGFIPYRKTFFNENRRDKRVVIK
jgi:hypothetical protein